MSPVSGWEVPEVASGCQTSISKVSARCKGSSAARDAQACGRGLLAEVLLIKIFCLIEFVCLFLMLNIEVIHMSYLLVHLHVETI